MIPSTWPALCLFYPHPQPHFRDWTLFASLGWKVEVQQQWRFGPAEASGARRSSWSWSLPSECSGRERSLSPSVKLKVWFQFYCENNLWNSSFCFVNTFVMLIASCYVCTLICAMWATNRVNQTRWKKKKMLSAEPRPQLVAQLPWQSITRSLIPGIAAQSGWWEILKTSQPFIMDTCVNWGFSFATVVCQCIAFFTISSGFTREVSRVCKSKGGGGWWGHGGFSLETFMTYSSSPKVSDSLVGKIDWRSLKWSDALVVSQEEWSGSQTDDISHSTPLSPGLVAVGQHSFLQVRFPCDWTFFVLPSLAVGASWPLGAGWGILCNSGSIHKRWKLIFMYVSSVSLHDPTGFRTQCTVCC